MNLFILLAFLLLNNALPGSPVPLEATTNCVAQNATLSSECNTCLCSANSTLCKDICEEVTSNNNSSDVNGNNEHVHTNQVCQPNDVKIEDCNRCKCAANGIGWFCTRRACPPPQRHQRQISSSATSVFECTPGIVFKNDCNTCFCTENREPICTWKRCHPKKRSLGVERRCTPGQSWTNRCNDCFCTETGVGVCTLRGCLQSGSFHDMLRPKTGVNSYNSSGVRLNNTSQA